MLPDDKRGCHRTGFAMTCYDGVTKHRCALWKRVTLENHPESKAPVDHYDCVDSLIDLYFKDLLKRQLQTTATVDALRKEVAEANDTQMVGAIAHLNNRMDTLRALPADAPKLLE